MKNKLQVKATTLISKLYYYLYYEVPLVFMAVYCTYGLAGILVLIYPKFTDLLV